MAAGVGSTVPGIDTCTDPVTGVAEVGNATGAEVAGTDDGTVIAFVFVADVVDGSGADGDSVIATGKAGVDVDATTASGMETASVDVSFDTVAGASAVAFRDVAATGS